MRSNTRAPFHCDPPATEGETYAVRLRLARSRSGANRPSKVNQERFAHESA